MTFTSTRIVGVREFRTNMAKICTEARKKKQRVVLVKNNIPMWEMYPADEEGILTDEVMKSIDKSLKEVRAGKFYTQEQVEEMIASRV